MLALEPRRITRDANHVYTARGVPGVVDGTTFPSVTTILDVLGATFSVAANYGAKHASMAAVDLADELPKMIATVGKEGAAKAIAQAGNNYRDNAAQLGTDVHALADAHVKGEPFPETMSDSIRQRVEKYAEWWKASGWTLRASEAMLLNPEMQYGGTLDLLCWDRDHKSVLSDIKTGARVYREAVLQQTAYGDATYIETDAGFYTMPPVDRYVILHVTTDGVREVELSIGALERMAWAACRDMYDWNLSMKGKRF